MPPAAVLINAIITASTIVMMASGLVLVFSVMGILNWTHGQLYMLGAFAVYYLCVKFGVSYYFALMIASVFVSLIGIIIEKGFLRPLTDKGLLPPTACALGLIFVFEGAAMTLFGKEQKAVPSFLGGVLKMGPVALSLERLVLIGMAILFMVSLYLFINRTKVGLAIRASAQEPVVAGMYGVHAGWLFTVVMAIGSALAGLAGGLIAPVYMVNPWVGTKPLILALAAIVLGGLGSFKGAVVGGMILGFITSVVAYYIGVWYELVSFLAIILVILFRPQGLYGQAEGRV
jgi:branched-chain amino acid transport system permease protein